MSEAHDVTGQEIRDLRGRLDKEASEGGYYLNPDDDFTNELVYGLIVNERRYGYRACPCRLASGVRIEDRDIICPCDYRDSDVEEFGACYCGLYVSAAVAKGTEKVRRIPDRRPVLGESAKPSGNAQTGEMSALPYPVWRCRVCGYLCARNEPPGVCPVCKASKDRFERFM